MKTSYVEYKCLTLSSIYLGFSIKRFHLSYYPLFHWIDAGKRCSIQFSRIARLFSEKLFFEMSVAYYALQLPLIFTWNLTNEWSPRVTATYVMTDVTLWTFYANFITAS